jgi:biofilm PGA synthesis protein PgaD
MNENTLILTERRLLPRFFDALLTLFAWLGFLFFLYANLLIQLARQPDNRWETLVASFSTVLVFLLIAVINGWLLILWYQYNRRTTHTRRHGRLSSLRHDELAKSFNVALQIISEMNQHDLLTVYHDQIGRIIDLKINPPAEGPESSSG